MDREQVVAGLAAAYRAGALTFDTVALEARKLAETDDPPTRPPATRKAPPDSDGPAASVTSRSDWRLTHLPPGTGPLPSVAHYDQQLTPRSPTAGDKEGSRCASKA